MNIKFVLVAVMAITLAACGGSSKNGNTTPNPNPGGSQDGGNNSGGGNQNGGDDQNGGGDDDQTGILSGYLENKINGSTLKFYALDGELLATTTSDTQGHFSIEVDIPTQPLLVEASGGSYVELYNQATVTANGTLRAYYNYTQGVNSEKITLSYLTSQAAGLIKYALVNELHSGSDAVDYGNEEISTITGFDILHTRPADLSEVNAGPRTDNELIYGFYTAAISTSVLRYVSINSGYNSTSFADTMYADLSGDMKLEGNSGAITIDSRSVTTDFYRNRLAYCLLLAGYYDFNKSGKNANFIQPAAAALNNSTHAIFANKAPVDLDEIELFDMKIEQDGLNQLVSFQLYSDFFDIASSTLSINDYVYAASGEILEPTFPILYGTHPTGINSATVEVTTTSGIKKTFTLSLDITNTPLVITSINLKNNEFVTSNFQPQFQVAAANPLHSYEVYIGQAYHHADSIAGLTSFSADNLPALDETISAEGNYTLRIVVLDNIGNNIELTRDFYLDTELPDLQIMRVSGNNATEPPLINEAYGTFSDIAYQASDNNLHSIQVEYNGEIVANDPAYDSLINSHFRFNRTEYGIEPGTTIELIIKAIDAADNITSRNILLKFIP